MTGPVASDAVKTPRKVLRTLLAQHHGDAAAAAAAFQAAVPAATVPLLDTNVAENDAKQDNVIAAASGQLIRVRLMVQDNSFSAQKYVQTVALRSSTKGSPATVVHTAFADTISTEESDATAIDVAIDAADGANDCVFADKFPFFAVAVPDEQPWASIATTNAGTDVPRCTLPSAVMDGPIREKIPLIDGCESNLHGFVLKFYGTDPQLHLCDVVDVVGVLDIPTARDTQTTTANGNNDYEEEDDDGELSSMLPPEGTEQEVFAQIPRIHVIYHEVAVRGLVATGTAIETITSTRLLETLTPEKVTMARDQFITATARILDGDHLAAEFVLLNSLSKIHHFSAEESPIGYLPVNLVGVHDQDTTTKLVTLLRSVLPRVTHVDMDLERLNSNVWVLPANGRELLVDSKAKAAADVCLKKTVSKEPNLDQIREEDGDNENNNDEDEAIHANESPATNAPSTATQARKALKLVSPTMDLGVTAGILQLAQGTTVVVDELSLGTGSLKEQGVRNLHALSRVIGSGKLDYVIPYGELRCSVDYHFLVVSEGKSMFAVDCVVPVVKNASSLSLESAKDHDDILDLPLVRKYFECLPKLQYSIPESLTNRIADDYVAARKQAPSTTAIDKTGGKAVFSNVDLSRRLEIARLVSRSKGEEELSEESWKYASELDISRLDRIAEVVSRHKKTASLQRAPLTSTPASVAQTSAAPAAFV